MKTNTFLGILLAIILGLVFYIVLSEPNEVIDIFDEASLREEIRVNDSTATYWQENAKEWENMVDLLDKQVDSLKQLKTDIYNDHNGKINFNSSATSNQLDSVIRANW